MTKPYYDDGQIALYLGTCLPLEDRPDVPVIDEWLTADVLVTDPPYGMAYNSGHVRNRPSQAIAGDENPELRDRTLAAWGSRPALVFGKWTVTRPAGTRHRLVWDKDLGPGMGDLAMPWGNGEEEIYVLGTGFAGKRESNVLKVRGYAAQAAGRPDHPTPKPPALMELLLDKCPAGIIADPYAGSGPTLIAAKLAGRRAVGVELEERYCEIAATRLSQQVFTMPPTDEVRASGWATEPSAFDFGALA